MNKIESILARLYDKMGFIKDLEFCKKYEIKKNTLSTWKKRDTIPYELLVNISQNENFSLDWLLTGKGEMFLKKEKAPLHVNIITKELDNHIADKELEILKAFRNLPAEKQEWYYYQLKADELKYKTNDLEDVKYA